jgi:hypothetical protein
MKVFSSSRSTLILVLTFGLLLIPTAALAQTDDRDCPDFSSRAEAQAAYDADPSDPERLDADDDGEACEDYDYGDSGEPETGTTRVPKRVETGGGGTASGNTGAIVVAILALAGLTAGTVVARTRTS